MDTPNKRMSAVYVGSPWRAILPIPDGSTDIYDMMHVAFHYRFGDTTADVTPPTLDATLEFQHRRTALLEFDHVREIVVSM